jgi:hypothetical protein
MSENLNQIKNLMNTPELCELILEQFDRACRPDRCSKYMEPKKDGPDVKRKDNLCDNEKCETKKTYLILLQRYEKLTQVKKDINKEDIIIQEATNRKKNTKTKFYII